MVLKPFTYVCVNSNEFESSVNSDGTQTYSLRESNVRPFESSVNSDGTQTSAAWNQVGQRFESSVNSDGTQTRMRFAAFFLGV